MSFYSIISSKILLNVCMHIVNVDEEDLVYAMSSGKGMGPRFV